MPSYIVSYDLRKVRNYDGLIAKLRQGGFISPLKSVWLGSTPANAANVRDDLRQHLDSDDGILVIELKPGSDWAFNQVDAQQTVARWLQSNVTP